MRIIPLSALLLASTAMPAIAATEEQPVGSTVGMDIAEEEQSEENASNEIVVIAERIRGSVDTDVPPVEELNEADIAAVGASSLTDLVAAVSPQTNSGRGRGGGQPVILLNGQRISGFRELRDLPPEAVKQVQIFPEEVALKYGFRPDQRVINFILKDNFSSFAMEVEHAQPEDGGFATNEFEATLTRIGAKTRINLDVQIERQTRLTENERDLIPADSSLLARGGNISGLGVNGEISPALSALAGSIVTQAGVPTGIANPSLSQFASTAGRLNDGNIGEVRTLLPETERLEVNGTWSRSLGPQSVVSINANYALNGSRSLLGLPGASFVLPGTSAFSPFGTDVTVSRYFDTPRPLERESETHLFQTGGTLNHLIGGWRWTVTGNYSRTDSETRTTRNVDFAGLRAAVLAGTANPFAADFGNDLVFLAPDLASSLVQNIDTRSTIAGSPFTLPAGEAQMTFASGFTRQMLDSDTYRQGVVTDVALRRNIINHSVNAELPLTGRDFGLGRIIGEWAINGNIGFSDLSDFGRLTEYGAGLRWSPAKNLTFQASITGDENAPGIGQLGNPLLVTPNVATFDFATGQSSFITVLSGGNPALVGEKRRDLILNANWNPTFIKDFGLQVSYFRNNSRNTTANFPLLTPEIEAAFPGRVTRDANGQLLSIDQRPVNFDQEKSQRIRWGFNVSGGIGSQPQGRGPMGGPPAAGGPGGGRPPGAGGPRGGGGGRGFGGGGGFGPGGGMPSRWNLALYHTYRIEEEILIRPGVPVLDLLNGSAVSSNGGASRHEIELSGGVFHKGFGLRLQGTYKSGTTADGTGLPGSTDLRFSDLAAINAFLFVNLDQQARVIKAMPFLKGSRITLRIDNILNDVIDVRDQNGNVPLGYQPAYLDPRGRVFELSFRKRF
ncbi:TonB-dependent receptor [Sphingorhabdus contaminans]|uniref:TonB-dependent receptor n=1 Tax=Sphingorhabdus contaminans TaxID=1343899 RepID=A0A553WJN2_9SPHN|nr:TonB-dependent receptor [Sphingorhabdus contaminans]TSB04841.1 TonB-dependent receptor [Sphingorhabdus contaminans]